MLEPATRVCSKTDDRHRCRCCLASHPASRLVSYCRTKSPKRLSCHTLVARAESIFPHWDPWAIDGRAHFSPHASADLCVSEGIANTVDVICHAYGRRARHSRDACRSRSQPSGVELEAARSYRRDGSTCRPLESLRSDGWRRSSRQTAAAWRGSPDMRERNQNRAASAPIRWLRHFSQLAVVPQSSQALDG
jgi:hypothetical protein